MLMTIGGIVVGVLALAGAFAAAAIRRRDGFWAATALLLEILVALTIVRSGLDATFVRDADDVAIVAGAFLLAGMVALGLGLPKSLEDRMLLGDRLPEWAFDQAVIQAREPFVAAARVGDPSSAGKARWHHMVTVPPPSSAWASLADGLAQSDAEWSDRGGLGAVADDPLPWQARTSLLIATWDALRGPAAGRLRERAAIVRGVLTIGTFAAATCLVIGFGHVATGITRGAPDGHAAKVPAHPPGRAVYLVPLGGFPAAELQDLADFYAVRYDLDVGILPPAPIPASLGDSGRHQVAAEDVTGLLTSTYSEAADPNRVVIGVVPADIYVRGIPEWQWAFGNRAEGHLAVISTARMNATGLFGASLAAARLRKMVTRDIGVLYFGLPLSDDPHSVLYSEILSVADLDRLGEDF
jgi:predicted Zn-dependent protease